MIAYDYAASTVIGIHAAAVRVLCEKMGWHGTYVAGATRRGYVWVDLTAADRLTI